MIGLAATTRDKRSFWGVWLARQGYFPACSCVPGDPLPIQSLTVWVVVLHHTASFQSLIPWFQALDTPWLLVLPSSSFPSLLVQFPHLRAVFDPPAAICNLGTMLTLITQYDLRDGLLLIAAANNGRKINNVAA